MAGHCSSSDERIARLIEMGFEYSAVLRALEDVGHSFDDAVEYLLSNDSCRRSGKLVYQKQNKRKAPQEGSLASSSLIQSSITSHLKILSTEKRRRYSNAQADVIITGAKDLAHDPGKDRKEECLSRIQGSLLIRHDEEDIAKGNWEERADKLLQEHFGYPGLKSFQKEALGAWLSHRDSLVLAATGSGKSLCFQIPALLTGKVVVVISPLISLMEDQCLKLLKHGISACFLGSGQPDSSVEQKAMSGVYNIIYVCPETILRLIKPLQELAESRGIALFAIDEVHCVSKWGHDFRPAFRKLSVLRESFSSSNLQFLKFDIPLMGLTATAPFPVREDVLEVLGMSNETKLVLTSFFRSNLRFSELTRYLPGVLLACVMLYIQSELDFFSEVYLHRRLKGEVNLDDQMKVKHSRTSSMSYGKDFHELIEAYGGNKKPIAKKHSQISEKIDDQFCSISEENGYYRTSIDYYSDIDDEGKDDPSISSAGKEMSVEYLENDVDIFHSVDDGDVAGGELDGQSPPTYWDTCALYRKTDPHYNIEEKLKLLQEPLEDGPTIIYVPTRKETFAIANYLCGFGVKAAAYNASLQQPHRREIHEEFHQNVVQVVVATIAFGMGIDKLNIRRVIHYGWPQSLEAYYQEAGRAGRDGKLAECTLYANLSTIPSLYPSKRSEDRTKVAFKLLSECFRYGMNTSFCRAKTLVEYFGEDFSNKKCLLCDVCVYQPPKMKNLKEEVEILMQVIASHYDHSSSHDCSDDDTHSDRPHEPVQKPKIRMLVSKIREKSKKFWTRDQLWWRGLARIMESKGYIREGDNWPRVQIEFPEPTKLGLEFLQSDREQPLYIIPDADMLLSMNRRKFCSTFADWGKGWADPETRRQRLEQKQSNRKLKRPRKRRKGKYSKSKPDSKTARGRIAGKLFK